MCQKCSDAVKAYWPDLPESEYKTLLMGATCFPFGTPEQTSQQLRDMAHKSGQNLDLALAIASEETEDALAQMNQQEQAKGVKP